MALGLITSPQINIATGLTMGENVAAGCAYVPDASGVLTKCGTGATLGLYPTTMALSGEAVEATFSGCVTALVGTGGCTVAQPLTYGANGTVVVATEGTDHVAGHALHTAAEAALITMLKTG